MRTPETYLAITILFAGSSPGGPSSAWETLLRTAVLALAVAPIHLVWLHAGAPLGCVLRHR